VTCAEPHHDLMKSHNIQEEVHDTYQTRKKIHEPYFAASATASVESCSAESRSP
jgi:hypothetical protein